MTASNIPFLPLWISRFTCHIELSRFSFRLKSGSVLIPGLSRILFEPSRSPYASQVVIFHKKSGEIRRCIDFCALNAITIRDSFPLPRIEEALQAVKAAVWFTSFDLAQGYLQLAMDEADIHKTAFRAGSSGLYEFT